MRFPSVSSLPAANSKACEALSMLVKGNARLSKSCVLQLRASTKTIPTRVKSLSNRGKHGLIAWFREGPGRRPQSRPDAQKQTKGGSGPHCERRINRRRAGHNREGAVPLAISRGLPDDRFHGLEQFRLRGRADDVGYCIAGPKPYALEFNNDADVMCLLLGSISTDTKFEEEPERPLLFAAKSSAFHPRGGNVRVRAHEVRHGFIAFSFSSSFQRNFDDIDLGRTRRDGSRNNIRGNAISSLSKYAQNRLRSGEQLTSFEIQSLGSLVYLETLRVLGTVRSARRSGLSDQEFAAISEFIDAELGNDLTCAAIATAANVPLRVVFDGMKLRTGMSPYQYVMEKRVERARHLLQSTEMPISEIALLCGFSSQQHLTSTLTSKLGQSPQKIRLNS
jgi:AraC family transcriptional regulator